MNLAKENKVSGLLLILCMSASLWFAALLFQSSVLANETNTDVFISPVDYTGLDGAEVLVHPEFQGMDNVIEWVNGSGVIEWEVDMPADGLYNISLEYYPIGNARQKLHVEFRIDGSLPFEESSIIYLKKALKDKIGINRDSNDNDVYSPAENAGIWLRETFSDAEGYSLEPYTYHFTKGIHKISLTTFDEPFYIGGITISAPEPNKPYSQVAGEYIDNGAQDAPSFYHVIQAENYDMKSDMIIRPLFDRSSPMTEPYSVSKIRLNTIGADQWKDPGQWISWKVTVPEDGLYQIALKARQQINQGVYTSRKLYIDGVVPFAEMNTIMFPFSDDWYIKQLTDNGGNSSAYRFYLTKGEHEIKLEVTLGDMSDTLNVLNSLVLDMNKLYRNIVMITGPAPDPLRDYYFETEIPGLVENLKRMSEILKDQSGKIKARTGIAGGETAQLDYLSSMLDGLAERPEEFNKRLETYKSNVSSLSAWINNIKSQPLELDYLIVFSGEQEMPRATPNLWESLKHILGTFFASFSEDFGTLDEENKPDSIKVWLNAAANQSGRDQAVIVKNLIENFFTPEYGINVDLSLVKTDLSQVILSGTHPDVAMNFGNPIDLAMRNAIEPIDGYEGFDEISKRFHESALTPLYFQGKCYALPDTQVFDMMFYRTDIFEQLNIKVPQTWDELYKIIPILQRNKLTMGLPSVDSQVGAGNNLFNALLMQRGGKIYNDDLSRTAFDDPVAYEVFKEITDLYLLYDLPMTYDFFSRFRTGEMPLAIVPYTTLSLLEVAAPEIKGLWDMVPIPGLPSSGLSDSSLSSGDNDITRAQGSGSTGIMMLKGSGNKESSWKFMEWWTSAETQQLYGLEMEALLGPAGRYPTANRDAFKQLPWTRQQRDNIMAQWEYVQGIPQIPGGYYTNRGLDNAFRATVVSGRNAREAFYKENLIINKEILRKRIEFGLEKE